MYKSRFTRWGLRKNAKRKGDLRSSVEKRHVDLSRHLPADGGGYSIPIVSSQKSRTMNLSTPLSHSLTTPTIPERVLGVIWDYIRGSFEAGTWVCTGDGARHCLSTKSTTYVSAHPNSLYNQSTLACCLFDKNCFQDAGKALVSATAQIKAILYAEGPDTLRNLFKTILYIHHRGRDEIAFAILRQFSAMAMAVLGDRHPICRLSGWLSSIDPSRLGDIIGQCLDSVRDHFASLLGPLHLTALVARIESMTDRGGSEGNMRDLLSKCESDLGWLDLRTFEVGLRLSWIYYGINKLTEAQNLSQKLLVRSSKLHSPAHKMAVDAECLNIMGMSQYALGEVDSAESSIRRAIALESGPSSDRTACWLLILEDWLLEQGREDSAAEARERRRMLQETIESDYW